MALPLTEAMMRKLPDWSGSATYAAVERRIWRLDAQGPVAGYVRTVGRFHQVCPSFCMSSNSVSSNSASSNSAYSDSVSSDSVSSNSASSNSALSDSTLCDSVSSD